ncbi:PHP domain-containing protein [Actinoplanes lobatus]|uniref:PHP domain-containing protein n=1 Tax=Actinoplanes lobatus TaxID=113568 RepID=A0A7W7HBR4_9ACTN|nr:PHP domain-containing protein [Actinoplanes lobatus]MBB4747612.1 putative hydrolase [Actinoplanes lobatus]GGN73877.1 PHP domain-containing protein [Actinoplanes lobatus]GIE39826.1 PHP domain-containing protein [Actinoplanes lobatus]
MASRDPVADLRRIAFLLERANEATYRVRAFRSAAATVSKTPPDELAARAGAGTLAKLPGIGDVTARCVAESLAGEEPVYLRRLTATEGTEIPAAAAALRAALRGDCHVHSDWSDGGSPIEEMALAAADLGHEYFVLTDHSPRLTVARGLTADRLRRQLDHVAMLNEALPEGFRILTGIEVDILEDGSLDQEEELLARLDVVVGSVHSKLRDDASRMTRRMVTAIGNPHLDVLGHMTGRKVSAAGEGDAAHRRARTRPPSDFDLEKVLAACLDHGKAIEINSRPDRLDPPKRMLTVAVEAGCVFSIDTDAHAPGQLDWLDFGCGRAALCGVPADRVVNTWTAERLLEWTGSHG